MYIVTHLTFKISLIRINSQQSNIDYHNLQIGHSQNGLYWCFFQLCEPKYLWNIHPTYIKLYMPEFVSARPFQTCHLVRIVRIQYGFWPFLRWYGRITLWYGFEANYWKQFVYYVERNKTVLSSTQLAFPLNFRKRPGNFVSRGARLT